MEAALPDAARSPLVRHVRAARELQARAFVALSAAEVAQLRANGNSAEDWTRVRKTSDAPLDAERIRDCSFRGRVVLGRFSAFQHQVDGVGFASGLYGAALSDVVVMDDALVLRSLALHGVVLEPRAGVVQCGSVLGRAAGQGGTNTFGNGQTLHVGVETGGRDLRVVADLSFDLAARLATERDNAELLSAYNAAVDAYVAALADDNGESQQGLTIIASDAQLLRCARVEASYIGQGARVDDCDVQDCTILSSSSEPTTLSSKSIVRHSILQFGASIRDLSVVEHALMTDCAHVKRHGVVMNAVLGANTCVAEGEVTSSLVGPFVGFHHQALLIASVWPEGKGNVGYGANVGSNHTLKAPDQELLPGEGVFFGLGCNIKFPTNLKDAPYSVIATAVTTLPQRIAMPFALINTPGHVIPGLSPAINEISPGWVLGSSIFTVLRNERKFRTRNKAKRAVISTEILNRTDIVALMKQARTALIAANGAKKTLEIPESGERVFTDRHIPGLGKNYLRESARKAGIAAYSFFIQLFALENLLCLVESGSVSVDSHVGALCDRTEFELQTLVEEFPAEKSVGACLRELVEKKTAVVKSAVVGKSRDDKRGERIVSDYSLVHTPADDEAVVQDARRAAEEVKKRVGAFLPRV